MAKTKTLPRKLFVKVEESGDESYFVADGELYALVEMGEKIKVGTYELVETTYAETVVKTSGWVKK